MYVYLFACLCVWVGICVFVFSYFCVFYLLFCVFVPVCLIYLFVSWCLFVIMCFCVCLSNCSINFAHSQFFFFFSLITEYFSSSQPRRLFALPGTLPSTKEFYHWLNSIFVILKKIPDIFHSMKLFGMRSNCRCLNFSLKGIFNSNNEQVKIFLRK